MPGLRYNQFFNFVNGSFNFAFVVCFVFQAIQQENATDGPADSHLFERIGGVDTAV